MGTEASQISFKWEQLLSPFYENEDDERSEGWLQSEQSRNDIYVC